MIAILNFTNLPLTPEQHKQITDGIVAQSEQQYIVNYPQSRVYEVPVKRTAKATIEAVPLDDLQWRTGDTVHSG